MSKIAILLPKEYMLEQARNVIREDELDIDILKVIKTSDSVYEARQAVEQGAEVVLARGVQAAFIRQYTNIPVAELTLTGQEIGLMIASAKKKVPDKKCPQIALIGFKNMFSDTTYADELFDILIRQGMMIRSCTSFAPLGDRFIRICFMSHEDNVRLMKAIENALKQ